ncbi:MAG: hypothetical protein LBD88_05055 [Candidatus Peribacteria bacterium]|jgi:hypothetical protein|nr:hypothetical protein [Candidatus Peribacteria bacterium]
MGAKYSFTLFLSYSFSILSVLQCGQIFFQSLWLITILIAEAIKNGSTHIFINLCIVAGAELVCIVEKTRCQVSAASVAKIAVSLSLISQTIIMSGSCLTIDLSPVENEYQISGFT